MALKFQIGFRTQILNYSIADNERNMQKNTIITLLAQKST